VNGSSSGAMVSVGDTVTFAARIHAAPGYPWPNGSISISDTTTGQIYGTSDNVKDPNSNDGLATIITSGIPAGSYTLVGTYGGDNPDKNGQHHYTGARSNTVSLQVKSNLGGPPPQPSLTIYANPGTPNGNVVPVSLTVINTGNAPATDITLNQIALRTLAGTGDANLLSPSVPLAVGRLQPLQSTVVTLQLQVPAGVKKLSLKEDGTAQDGGTVYHFSSGQVIFP
jgi:hypothetical protein